MNGSPASLSSRNSQLFFMESPDEGSIKQFTIGLECFDGSQSDDILLQAVQPGQFSAAAAAPAARIGLQRESTDSAHMSQGTTSHTSSEGFQPVKPIAARNDDFDASSPASRHMSPRRLKASQREQSSAFNSCEQSGDIGDKGSSASFSSVAGSTGLLLQSVDGREASAAEVQDNDSHIGFNVFDEGFLDDFDEFASLMSHKSPDAQAEGSPRMLHLLSNPPPHQFNGQPGASGPAPSPPSSTYVRANSAATGTTPTCFASNVAQPTVLGINNPAPGMHMGMPSQSFMQLCVDTSAPAAARTQCFTPHVLPQSTAATHTAVEASFASPSSACSDGLGTSATPFRVQRHRGHRGHCPTNSHKRSATHDVVMQCPSQLPMSPTSVHSVPPPGTPRAGRERHAAYYGGGGSPLRRGDSPVDATEHTAGTHRILRRSTSSREREARQRAQSAGARMFSEAGKPATVDHPVVTQSQLQNLMQKENVEGVVPTQYLLGVARSDAMNAEWRRRLVSWIFVVCSHEAVNMSPETAQTAVNYLDRFLSEKPVPVDSLQMLALLCVIVASKVFESSPLRHIEAWEILRKEVYPNATKDEFLLVATNLEVKVLAVLQWNVLPPTPFGLQGRFLQLCVQPYFPEFVLQTVKAHTDTLLTEVLKDARFLGRRPSAIVIAAILSSLAGLDVDSTRFVLAVRHVTGHFCTPELQEDISACCLLMQMPASEAAPSPLDCVPPQLNAVQIADPQHHLGSQRWINTPSHRMNVRPSPTSAYGPSPMAGGWPGAHAHPSGGPVTTTHAKVPQYFFADHDESSPWESDMQAAQASQGVHGDMMDVDSSPMAAADMTMPPHVPSTLRQQEPACMGATFGPSVSTDAPGPSNCSQQGHGGLAQGQVGGCFGVRRSNGVVAARNHGKVPTAAGHLMKASPRVLGALMEEDDESPRMVSELNIAMARR